MDIIRTPDKFFDNLKDYPFEPCYTTIKTHDDTDLRIHHIDACTDSQFGVISIEK